jgi:hypothetical protein
MDEQHNGELIPNSPQRLLASPDDMIEVNAEKAKKKWLKYVFIIAVLAALILIAYFLKGLFVVAVVNGQPISRLSVVRELEKRAGKDTLEFLVEKTLIEREARKQKIAVTAEEVQEAIHILETNVQNQGQTLTALLAIQGMTRKDLDERITIQKTLEKLVGMEFLVSDEEVSSFIAANAITFPKGTDEEKERANIQNTLRQQKRDEAIQKLVSRLREEARIWYFVTY